MGKVVNNPSFTAEDGVSNEKKIEVETEIAELTKDEQPDNPETQEKKIEEEINEEVQTKETAPEKIKIGEAEYTSDELQTIVEKGTKVKAWETKMPGFDIDKLMPDYTRKSQRLAEIEKRHAPKQSDITSEQLTELGVDDAQVKAFETVAKHLGFVRQTDLVQDSVEAQKDAFIMRHPEYKPGTLVSDAKWQQLMDSFSLYNWQSHPHKVEEMLEEAHSKISPTWQETERGGKVKETIVTQKAKATATALGGGSSKSMTTTTTNKEMADRYRALGWSEEDIKEILT